MHVQAGPHELGVMFPRKTFALAETERQPYLAHFNMDRHPRIQTARLLGLDRRPVRRRRGHATRPAVVVSSCCQAGERASSRRRAAPGDRVDAGATRVSTAGHRRRHRSAARVLQRGARRRRLRRRHRDGAPRDSREHRVPVPHRAGSAQASRRNRAYRVSDVELASRLSFFLWSSVPDDELLDLAIAGKLKRPAILEQQVKRMLADPQADALVTNFAGQWLYLRNLAAASPDARMFPDFDDNLRQAFRRETELFFDSIVTEDRSVARSAARELHVRQRAAGEALRHSERVRQPLQARDARRRQRARRDSSARAAF